MRRFSPRNFLLLVIIGVCLALTTSAALAESPDPFLADVTRIGVRVHVEPHAGVETQALAGSIAASAAEALRHTVDPPLPVIVLDAVDPRLVEPHTLVVLIHARIKRQENDTADGTRSHLVFAWQLGRADRPGLSGNLFPAPPDSIAVADLALLTDGDEKTMSRIDAALGAMARRAMIGRRQ